MSCREFRCTIKHDIIMDLAVIFAAVIVGISALSLTNIDLVKLMLIYFLVLIPIHEYAHYFTLKFLGKNAKIRFFTRYVALMVEYLDEVTSRELFYVVLAPQIIITFPLILLYIATRSIFIYAQLILHTASSIPDLINSLRYITVFRNHRFRLCREDKKIVGYIVIKPGDKCILYTL